MDPAVRVSQIPGADTTIVLLRRVIERKKEDCGVWEAIGTSLIWRIFGPTLDNSLGILTIRAFFHSRHSTLLSLKLPHSESPKG